MDQALRTEHLLNVDGTTDEAATMSVRQRAAFQGLNCTLVPARESVKACCWTGAGLRRMTVASRPSGFSHSCSVLANDLPSGESGSRFMTASDFKRLAKARRTGKPASRRKIA